MASTPDLRHVPWLPPPPGRLSNFQYPESRASAFIIVLSIFLAVVIVFVVLRLYVRLRVLRSPWWDDGEMSKLIRIEPFVDCSIAACLVALVSIPGNLFRAS